MKKLFALVIAFSCIVIVNSAWAKGTATTRTSKSSWIEMGPLSQPNPLDVNRCNYRLAIPYKIHPDSPTNEARLHLNATGFVTPDGDPSYVTMYFQLDYIAVRTLALSGALPDSAFQEYVDLFSDPIQRPFSSNLTFSAFANGTFPGGVALVGFFYWSMNPQAQSISPPALKAMNASLIILERQCP